MVRCIGYRNILRVVYLLKRLLRSIERRPPFGLYRLRKKLMIRFLEIVFGGFWRENEL